MLFVLVIFFLLLLPWLLLQLLPCDRWFVYFLCLLGFLSLAEKICATKPYKWSPISCHRGWGTLLFLLDVFLVLLMLRWENGKRFALCLPIFLPSCLRQMIKACFIVCLCRALHSSRTGEPWRRRQDETKRGNREVVCIIPHWHHVDASPILSPLTRAMHRSHRHTVNILRLIHWHLISSNATNY